MIEYSEIRKVLLKVFGLFFVLNISIINSSNGQHLSECPKKIVNIYKLPSTIATEWQLDKNGCKKLRGKYVDTILKNKNALIGINSEIFKIIFGNPELEDASSKEIRIFYYNLSTECEKGMPSKKSDNGRIFFSFKNEILFDIGQQVE
jgi:hypothetical protein